MTAKRRNISAPSSKDTTQNIKWLEELPPNNLTGTVALDLEILQMDRKQLHRPSGKFGSLGVSDGTNVWLILNEKDVPAALKRINKCQWAFHNASFDIRQLRRWAIVEPREIWDTLLMERILFGGWYDSFELRDLARRYLGVVLSKETRKQMSTADVMTSEMKLYAAKDALYTAQIVQAQRKVIETGRDDALLVWTTVDQPAFWATLDFKGFKLDRKRWLSLAEENRAVADKTAAELGFNPGSPVQVKAALAKAKIKVENTRELTLQDHADNPLVQKILTYREAAKRASTYGTSFVEDYVEDDDRIYSEYQTVKAETGRMASGGPNMQNQPHDPEYRACFVAGKGNRLLIADYSQQEPRCGAALSQDVELLAAFASGEDVHLAVARLVYHDPNMEKSDPRRRHAKTLNLGISYGLTAQGLSLRTGLPIEECEDLVLRYFKRFSGLKRWIDASRRDAMHYGYVSTAAGRRVWINPYSRQWMNNAINAPIQGTAADITKRALGFLHAYYGSNLPVVAVVHDEIVMEVPTGEANKHAKVLRDCMERAFAEIVPGVSRKNLVDISIGKTWAEKH